tara:strand:+ start:80 stop:268 length:189 start_codon:yes stop_codon:yes gene_type:complete
MLKGFVAGGFSTAVLVDLAKYLFITNPAASARALVAAAIVFTAWTAAQMIDAIVWQSLLPRR